MRYCSTLDSTLSVDFSEAVLTGIAPGGGLYLPETFDIRPVEWVADFADFAAKMLIPFTASSLGRAETLSLARRAFTFPVQWREISRRRYQLELFHGPSCSFKDFGAQFLAQVLAIIPSKKERLVVVATSGDTGSAVAAAFHQMPGVRVVILYPKGRVSERQAHQLSCWGDNISTLAVSGSFDECQALVKALFKEKDLNERYELTTANSINIGRLLPQMTYFAYTSLLCERLHRQPMNLIIPTGNCGHLTAACWARQLGYPIGKIVAAQNANHPLVDYVKVGYVDQKSSVDTIANAMDVASPSNFARLKALYPQWDHFSDSIEAYAVSDEEIKSNIAACFSQTGEALCPHTATAFSGLPSIESDDSPWTIAATAHPAKFETIVEPIIGESLILPDPLKEQLDRRRREKGIEPDMHGLVGYISTLQAA